MNLSWTMFYFVLAMFVGPFLMVATVAYYIIGLNVTLNAAAGIITIVWNLMSAIALVAWLYKRHFIYILSPLSFLYIEIFSFCYCPEEVELPLTDWRVLSTLALLASHSIISVLIFIRLRRIAPIVQPESAGP